MGGLALRGIAALAARGIGPGASRGVPLSRLLGTGGAGAGLRRAAGIAGSLLTGAAVASELSEPFFSGSTGGGRVVAGPIRELDAGMIFPTGEVLGKVWSTNGQFNNMAMTMDGKKGIALRNDGTVRIFRYQKHIVVSRNPRARDVARASKRLDRLMSGLVKTGTTSKRAKSKTR